MVECIEQVLPVAREQGIILGLENHYKDGFWHYPEFAQKMDVFLELLEAIPEREYFGVQYDPSNAIVAGDDPVELLRAVRRPRRQHARQRPLSERRLFASTICANSDGRSATADALQHGVTGRGLNDYDAIFQILRDVGYDGWVSIEDGMNGMEEMRASLEFLHRMREEILRSPSIEL